MARKPQKNKPTKKANYWGSIMLGLLSLLFAVFSYTIFLRPATNFKNEEITILIPTEKATKKYTKPIIKQCLHAVHFTTFLALADWFGYWEKIKPGKYTIEKGTSVFGVFRKLYGGRQTPIKIILNKFRTKKDLANYVGGKLECSTNDIYKYITSKDSLESIGISPEELLSIIIPNTYEIYWNTNPREFIERMQKESDDFWNDTRIGKAQKLGLSKTEISIIASIVEEETNDDNEKPLMASVYINRLKKNMPLGADPTIKFAIGDFSIRRVTLKHISETASSPYNTYKNKGLPPGPICTPSITSIDAVLEGKETTYLFFCAKPDFSGSHSFASTDEEHLQNAKRYRRALDSLKIH
jgi:UPF0755 protein